MSTGNSEKGVTFPEMGKAVIQSCKCADPILAVAYLEETSLILEVLYESCAFGHAKKDVTFDRAEQARCGGAEVSSSIMESKPRVTKRGRGSSLTYER